MRLRLLSIESSWPFALKNFVLRSNEVVRSVAVTAYCNKVEQEFKLKQHQESANFLASYNPGFKKLN